MENEINPLGLNEQDETEVSKKINTSVEQFNESKTLRTLGFIILALGIILSVIIFFSTLFITTGDRYYTEKVVNPLCFIYLFTGIFISLCIWSLFNVLSNISNNLTLIAKYK